MAHFAGIDANNVVRAVNRIADTDAPTEAEGVAFCHSLWGTELTWLQTSYNGSIRKNYAGVGYTYDAGRDAFIPPKPAPDYIFREKTCRWMHPSWPGEPYEWSEQQQGWVLP